MADNSYAKDSVGWQIQRLQRQLSEWAEVQFANNAPDMSSFSIPALPDWLAQALLLIFLVIVAVALTWLLLRLFLPDVLGWFSQVAPSRLESRSSPDIPAAAVWLRRSHQWEQQGNYREACRALYMAMIERLAETQQVPRKLSRTDGDYRCCVQHLEPLHAYQELINVHEQLCFGHGEITAELWQRCQQAYRNIK